MGLPCPLLEWAAPGIGAAHFVGGVGAGKSPQRSLNVKGKRRMSHKRAIVGMLRGLAVLLLIGGSAAAAAARPLTVCADPNYLPYSNRMGQGFENKVAEVIGQALGRPVQYVWSSYRQPGGFDNFLALNLDKNRCDIIMDLPYGDVEEHYTDPYYGSTYVFVYKKGRPYDLSGGMDSPVLRHVKIGFEMGTPPEMGLKMRGLLLKATPFDTAEKPTASPKTTLQAVQDGKVDVLITWEPAVGYFIKKDYPDLTMTRVPDTNALGSPERYLFFMSLGVAPAHKHLIAQLNAAIKSHKAQIKQIMDNYDVGILP